MDKFLVTGGTGFFGLNFLKNLENNIFLLGNKRKLKKSHRQIIYLPKLDKKNLIKFIIKNNIKVIIHAAAITDLDFAEKNKLITYNANFRLTKTISDIVKMCNLKLVFISTDQLYDNLQGYSNENQKVKIQNYYSYTKHLSENYIKKNTNKYWIIRCSFFGWGTNYKKSLFDFIYTNLKKKNVINLWNNIYFNPVYVTELIDISMKIINFQKGIYNIGSKKKISKLDFGILIANEFNLDANNIKSVIYENKELIRPKDMSVDITKIKKIFYNYNFEIKNQLKLLKNDSKILRPKILKY